MTKRAIMAFVLSSTLACSSANAQTKERVNELMNGSAICSSFKIKLSELAKLVGFDVPDLVPDTDLGVDKDHHEATLVEVSGDKVRVQGTVACQPSEKAVPFEPPFSLDPAALRASDNFDCSASLAGKTVSNMACTTSGEIGKVLANAVDLNGKMTAVMTEALK